MAKKMLVDQFAEFSAAVVRSLPRDMDSETAQAWILDQKGLKAVLATALLRSAAEVPAPEPPAVIEYVTPLADADVPETHRATLAKYRKLSSEHGVPDSTAVCYQVKAGFTLKSHAPKAGPCHEQFRYLQNWDFPDEPTRDSIVFWVPCLVSGSTNKSASDQIALLSELRTRLELPTHHMSGFGKVVLLAGLILAHFKATGERIQLIARSDTCYADGDRLGLGWREGALRCGDWNVDGRPGPHIGVFALGVEALGT